MCPKWANNLINRPIIFWLIYDCKHRVIQDESQGTHIGKDPFRHRWLSKLSFHRQHLITSLLRQSDRWRKHPRRIGSLRFISASWPILWIIFPAVPGIYRERHPEHMLFYRVFFYYFERFLREYEPRFEKEYGYFRPVIQDVIGKYLDCANPKCEFARIRCPDCGEEQILMFSCKTRGFCPSCHAKRREEWGEYFWEL